MVSNIRPQSLIFLDIDNVLWDPEQANHNCSLRQKANELFHKSNEGVVSYLEYAITGSHFFDKTVLTHLNTLIKKVQKVADVQIVICSKWRTYTSLQQLKERVFDRTGFADLIVDVTPINNECREKQIQEWLENNPNPLRKSFVILDDNGSEFRQLFQNQLVEIAMFGLLTEADASKAEKILLDPFQVDESKIQ